MIFNAIIAPLLERKVQKYFPSPGALPNHKGLLVAIPVSAKADVILA
jgi:hypothetical protein